MTATHVTAAAGDVSPAARPRPEVEGALYVDLGEHRGDHWVRPPRARYECLRCRTTEGPVTGPDSVTAFTASVRAHHRTRCDAPQEHRS